MVAGAVRGWDRYFFPYPAYWSRSHSKWRLARVSQWLPESMTAASHPRTGQWKANGKPPPTPTLYETHTMNGPPTQNVHSNSSAKLVCRRRWPGRQWFPRKFPGRKKINESSADNVHQLRFKSRLQTKVEGELLWTLNPQFLAKEEKNCIYSWLFKQAGLWTLQIYTANSDTALINYSLLIPEIESNGLVCSQFTFQFRIHSGLVEMGRKRTNFSGLRNIFWSDRHCINLGERNEERNSNELLLHTQKTIWLNQQSFGSFNHRIHFLYFLYG